MLTIVLPTIFRSFVTWSPILNVSWLFNPSDSSEDCLWGRLSKLNLSSGLVGESSDWGCFFAFAARSSGVNGWAWANFESSLGTVCDAEKLWQVWNGRLLAATQSNFVLGSALKNLTLRENISYQRYLWCFLLPPRSNDIWWKVKSWWCFFWKKAPIFTNTARTIPCMGSLSSIFGPIISLYWAPLKIPPHREFS